MKNRKWLKILLFLLAAVILGVVFICQSNQTTPDNNSESFELVDNESASESASQDSESKLETTVVDKVCVHVCGSVKSPGVYYLVQGSRVHEAVEAAGGLLKNAASDYVNLAETITDGQQIYIPSKKEVENGKTETEAVSGVDSSQSENTSLVDLNKADLSELTTLPGIGETKAQAIITYREDNGAFNSIDEITNVSGIGSSTFEKIKDYIKV